MVLKFKIQTHEVVEKYRRDVCITYKVSKKNSRPNTSEESQFHQPPHVPSWNAHQLPRMSAKRL